jgi:3-oxoacyl-[acyl-carrier protein] reductase
VTAEVPRPRGAIVTGVGRCRGIAAAVCRRLVTDGWTVVAFGHPPYDAEVEWNDPGLDHIERLIAELTPTDRFTWHALDLEPTAAAVELFAIARSTLLSVDALVLAHARSMRGGVLEVTAEEFDRHVAVNARATLFLIAEFARAWNGSEHGGRVVTFVSGPPLRGEIAYAASKGAIEWTTRSAAAELASSRVTVNAVDPGPTDTGWITPAIADEIAATSPRGRPGTVHEAADCVAFLLSDAAAGISGQVVRADRGPFRGNALAGPEPA